MQSVDQFLANEFLKLAINFLVLCTSRRFRSHPFVNEFSTAYVKKSDTQMVYVQAIDHRLVPALLGAGFTETSTNAVFLLDVKSDAEKAKIFDVLQSLDVAFSDGKDGVLRRCFQYLRDKGLLIGSFIKISLAKPENYCYSEL